jgi:IS30 family transposase
MTLLQPLADRTATRTATAIIQRLSSEVFETLTLDNGKEFAEHLRIAKELSGNVYFCDPYSPWQRPSNENSNRISRRSFPKGTDFSKISDHEVALVEHILNNTPRKILGYATPWEIYSGKAELPESGAL